MSVFVYGGGGAGGGAAPTTDAFKSAVEALSQDKALYTLKDITIGDLANGATLFEDELAGEPDINLVTALTGNFKCRYGGVPSDLTTRKVAYSDQRGTADYGVVASALSFNVGAVFVVFCAGDFQAWTGLVGLDGTSGTPNPNTDELIIYADQVAVGYNVNAGAGLATVNHNRASVWMTVGMRESAGTTTISLSEVGQAFESVGTNTNTTVWTKYAGLRVNYDGSGGGLTADAFRIAAIVPMASASAADLQSLHDALSMQVPT